MMEQKSYVKQAEDIAKANINQRNLGIKQCKESIKGYNKTISNYENEIKKIKSDFKKEFGKDL